MRAAGDCTRCIASREAGHSRKVARRARRPSPGSGSSPENARRRKMQRSPEGEAAAPGATPADADPAE